MNIVFFGSDDFAATNLERLIRDGHHLSAVVTQPDRPRGRGMNISLLPVKMLALEQNIPVLQPESLQGPDICGCLKEFDADVFVVIAYGLFLPPEVLSIPKKFCLNVHGSLLPQYRGAAPVDWAILHARKETGVSVIRMNERMDAGDVMLRKSLEIDPQVNAQELKERLAKLGAAALIEALKAIETGQAVFEPQDEAKVSFAPKLTRELGRIDWSHSAVDIHNQVRGLSPWPGAFTGFEGKRLKVLETGVFDETLLRGLPGEIIHTLPEGFVVACGQGQILIKRLQLDSAKPMNAHSFGVGHEVKAGDIFSSPAI